ncbi:hypothetical protein F4778DRAFT_769001 [Xylariomycetidae sp. FL2044]|nr:hypothetical protein F4778DRAFT_769001 [Xylariomycetidae sp. FL2044]
MNDANLNENLDYQTQPVDGSDHEAIGHQPIQSEQGHLDPTRWWVASAAFPMIAGTLGPVASAFSICALVRNWRQKIEPGSDVTKAVFVPDPPWLYAVNGVQLVIALVSNVFLLLNMTKRIRFSVAQPVTIVGWYISSICLIALCATASGPLLLPGWDQYVWSQAFYYGVFAAILYFIVASLMVVTVYGAETGHYAKDFELTTSQRTLMLQTIAFLMYLLVGALVFSTIEGWNYLDTVYWADVTLFTVGYGDFYPVTNLGRGLFIPYSLVGIITLGLVIGSIRSLMLDRGKRRMDARMLERKRRKFIRQIRRRGKGDLLEPIAGETPDDYFPENKGPVRPRTEYERRQKEFHLMRTIQQKADKKKRWTAMGISTSTFAVLWLVGGKIFQECEKPYQGWSYFDGVYFAFTGLTTIGYGDLTPVSNSAKAFFVFWSLLALPTMTILISNAGDTVIKGIKDGTIWLGNLTILPGDQGFKTEAKRLISKFSPHAFDKETEIEEAPPGFLGAAQPHREDEDDDEESDDGEAEGDDEARDAGRIPKNGKEVADEPFPEKQEHKRQDTWKSKSSTKRRGRTSSKREPKPEPPQRRTSVARENVPTELPKSRAEYHLVLIDEIARVTRHLQHTPPRKYTFKEWAWYFRLIGEDESSADTHRKPAKRPEVDHGAAETETTTTTTTKKGPDHPYISSSHAPSSSPMDNNNNNNNNNNNHVPISSSSSPPYSEPETRAKWSWVGHRSPLMDTREEADWILEKLEERLREELQGVVREQAGGEEGIREVKAEERENEMAPMNSGR